MVQSNAGRKWFTWVSILAGVTIVISTVFVATFISKQIAISKKRIQQNLVGPIVGTWKGEMGNIVNFRADGTARSRPSSVDRIGYLEWKFESGQLAIYQYSKGRYSFGWLSRRVTMEDNPTSRFSIVDVSPTHFKRRTDDGKEFTLTATEDKDLECAK